MLFLPSLLVNMVSKHGLEGGVLGSSHLFAIHSPFVDLKVYGGLYLVCLTLHVQV